MSITTRKPHNPLIIPEVNLILSNPLGEAKTLYSLGTRTMWTTRRNSMSARNLTLYIPGEVAEKMDKLQEVNWSRIARDAIERYIDERLSMSVPPEVISKLRKEMGEEFVNGKQFAVEHILPKLAYKQLAQFFEAARIRAEKERSAFAVEVSVEEELLNLDVKGAALRIMKDYFKEIPKDATDQFQKGAFYFINEAWEVLRKSESGPE